MYLLPASTILSLTIEFFFFLFIKNLQSLLTSTITIYNVGYKKYYWDRLIKEPPISMTLNLKFALHTKSS